MPIMLTRYNVDKLTPGDCRQDAEPAQDDESGGRELSANRTYRGHAKPVRTDPKLTLGPPLYSITSSARTKTLGGIVNPSALATFRLTTSSNLVGCSIGMFAGFSPFRILST